MIGVVVDMNLPPRWAVRLRQQGWQAIHWSEVGPGGATDAQVMRWAADRGYIVLTQDLDFPALLASTQAQAPSVIVIRAPDVLSEALMDRVAQLLGDLQTDLQHGAIISVEIERSRVRILPL